jgi:hypothetical protein
LSWRSLGAEEGGGDEEDEREEEFEAHGGSLQARGGEIQ